MSVATKVLFKLMQEYIVSHPEQVKELIGLMVDQLIASMKEP